MSDIPIDLGSPLAINPVTQHGDRPQHSWWRRRRRRKAAQQEAHPQIHEERHDCDFDTGHVDLTA